jgi:hypothetical protein
MNQPGLTNGDKVFIVLFIALWLGAMGTAFYFFPLLFGW